MKRITLMVVAFLGAISMNAQSDCATAEVVTVAADASVTVSSTGVAGTAPTQICNGYYALADITAGAWYSYTNSGAMDLLVTVTADFTDETVDYVPSFNIASGSCGSLTCVGGSLITQDQGGNLLPAEDTFLAVVGETYYIIFDDYYANGVELGTTAAFTFDVTTDSDVPAVPGVATNPIPADQATDVAYYELETGETAMDFAWDAPTTGDPVDFYYIEISTDPNFPTEATVAGNFAETSIQGLYISSIPDYFTDSTTYYWRVTPQNVAGGTTPVVWSFTTGTLGIEDNQLAEISLYPNPVHGQLNINLPSSVELESATMFDLLGKATNMNIGENNTLNTSNLATGVYILKLETTQGALTKKVIKQ